MPFRVGEGGIRKNNNVDSPWQNIEVGNKKNIVLKSAARKYLQLINSSRLNRHLNVKFLNMNKQQILKNRLGLSGNPN